MRDPGANSWTVYTPANAAGDTPPPMPGDALSDPTVEDLLPSGLACWPRGAAWGTPDGMAARHDTVLAGFTRALLGSVAEAYRRLWRLVLESSATTMAESLAEWEADYGLPDACTAVDQTTAGRRQAVLARVRGNAMIHPLDFVRLAHERGFSIAIEEPAVFECGFSVCGGGHTVGDRLQEVYWIVHVTNLAVDYFVCGESECGLDPLFNIAGIDRLRCLFRDLYPGWSQPVFLVHDDIEVFFNPAPVWLDAERYLALAPAD